MGIKHMATRIVFTLPKQSVKQWIHESELLLSLWSTSGIFELDNKNGNGTYQGVWAFSLSCSIFTLKPDDCRFLNATN